MKTSSKMMLTGIAVMILATPFWRLEIAKGHLIFYIFLTLGVLMFALGSAKKLFDIDKSNAILSMLLFLTIIGVYLGLISSF
ncbi:MAG: hypothetical protein NTZ44_02030 [Candidatus Nomurabacteria bacterium]|nr:hypothetical protein [Candidatus Nomurabacteria bacterium]